MPPIYQFPDKSIFIGDYYTKSEVANLNKNLRTITNTLIDVPDKAIKTQKNLYGLYHEEKGAYGKKSSIKLDGSGKETLLNTPDISKRLKPGLSPNSYKIRKKTMHKLYPYIRQGMGI